MLEAIFVGNVKVFGKTMKTTAALKSIGEPVIVIEPGRSITETSGILLMKITGIRKVNGDHNLISMDAGAVNYDSAVEKDYLMRHWIARCSFIIQEETKSFPMGRSTQTSSWIGLWVKRN
jgi:diaminopimelate decarboxylase